MALISCPECGRQISDKAICCPGCNYPLNKAPDLPAQSVTPKFPVSVKKPSAASVKAVCAVLVITLIVGLIWGVSDNRKNKQTYEQSYSQSNSDYYKSTPVYGFSGAVAKAQSYLRSSAFSYEGLVHQLEYEGFSSDEAQYGAANCGADWNEQAVRCARSYTGHTGGFSYQGLLNQLEYEGFTSSQAQHGVDHCGADWNEQAVKAAKSYMRTFPDWSRSDLIDQLEYEDFTYSQAKYGADHCGAF